jgi:hypothetical protein
MQSLTYWKTVTRDKANLIEQLFALLDEHQIRYCVIGGQAVNAYVDPLISLDLDLVIALEQLEETETLLATKFHVRRFPYSLNISLPDSNVRVQIQTDPRYFEFVDRSEIQEVLGLPLSVASVEDVLQGKIWAFQDPARRTSKRLKDLVDITRILEGYPQLRSQVPIEILAKLNSV